MDLYESEGAPAVQINILDLNPDADTCQLLDLRQIVYLWGSVSFLM